MSRFWTDCLKFPNIRRLSAQRRFCRHQFCRCYFSGYRLACCQLQLAALPALTSLSFLSSNRSTSDTSQTFTCCFGRVRLGSSARGILLSPNALHLCLASTLHFAICPSTILAFPFKLSPTHNIIPAKVEEMNSLKFLRDYSTIVTKLFPFNPSSLRYWFTKLRFLGNACFIPSISEGFKCHISQWCNGWAEYECECRFPLF